MILPAQFANEVHEGENAVSPASSHEENIAEGEKPPTPPLPPDKSVDTRDIDNSKTPPDDDGGDGYAWK